MIDILARCVKCHEAIEVELTTCHGTMYPVFAHLCDEGRRQRIANMLSWHASGPVPSEISAAEHDG
jgi:hypothetical protein